MTRFRNDAASVTDSIARPSARCLRGRRLAHLLTSHLLSRPLVIALIAATLPAQASAATMEGVISGLNSGNALGSFDLSPNAGQDQLGFEFVVGDLKVEGTYWENMMSFAAPGQAGYTEALYCPRAHICVITMGRTRVRVEYTMRSGYRYATNITKLDAQ